MHELEALRKRNFELEQLAHTQSSQPQASKYSEPQVFIIDLLFINEILLLFIFPFGICIPEIKNAVLIDSGPSRTDATTKPIS